MFKFEPITFMTVTVDGEKHTLVRDELMKNDVIANTVELYEKMFQDLEQAEYERTKILLAFNSQRNQLMAMVDKYAKEKYGVVEETEEATPEPNSSKNKVKPTPPKSRKVKEASDS